MRDASISIVTVLPVIPTNRRHSCRFSGPYINSWRPLARSGLAGVRPALRLRAPCDRPGSGLRSCARAAPARTLLPDDLFAGLASRGLRRGVAQGPSRPSVVSRPGPLLTGGSPDCLCAGPCLRQRLGLGLEHTNRQMRPSNSLCPSVYESRSPPREPGSDGWCELKIC